MTATGYVGGDPSKVDVDGYTKGDLLAANAAGVLTAIPVGVDTNVLTADSADAEGVDWQAGGGGGGGTPSNTVVTETSFGQGSTAGALVTYSRGDHTHGTPAAPATISPAITVVSETAFGQAPAVGAGVLYARNDHTHGTPTAPSVPAAATTVVTETSFGQASAVGVDAIYARQDHTHGTPAAPSVPSSSATVVTETTFGQASTAGAAATFSRGDHTHGTPTAPSVPAAATTVVTETSFGQSSAVGVATTYSREDHTHGTPASTTLQTRLVVRSGFITSGNIATNVGGTFTLLGLSGIQLPAAIGDYVEFFLGFMEDAANFLDAAVVVGGSAVRYMSTDTNTPAIEGSPWWYAIPGTYRTSPPPFAFTVVSGDLASGNVNVDLAAKGSGGGGLLFASTNYPFRWRAINYGVVS